MNTPIVLKHIEEISTTTGGRRRFMRKLGLMTAGTAGIMAIPSRVRAQAAEFQPNATDVAVLNFALNLEYLEAEYYLAATTAKGLEDAGIDVDGGNGQKAKSVIIKMHPKVKFDTASFEDYANEIANDEANHVRYIRETLTNNGASPVARPQIDLRDSFKALGNLIGVNNFDPFADEVSFLLGAFIFEDVGVTAYKGASPLLTDKNVLESAAGILGTEAYHAGVIRTLLYAQGPDVRKLAGGISNVRSSLDNSKKDRDQGISRNGMANLIPTDGDSIAFSRSTRQVLNIVYGKVGAQKGLFFPEGVNGSIS